MRIITDRKEIQNAEEQLAHSLESLRPETVQVRIGHQSASVVRHVQWVESLGIWARFGEILETESNGARYLNTFGLGKPEGAVGMVCEINSPLEGIKRSVGGAFAEDSEGSIAVVHRGAFTIAGGMTKEFFRQRCSGQYVSIVDGNRTSEVILVGALRAKDFAHALRDFIVEVDRIKELGRRANKSQRVTE